MVNMGNNGKVTNVTQITHASYLLQTTTNGANST